MRNFMPNDGLIIAKLWDSYLCEVLPPNAPLIQKVECRRAFYAGAHGLFQGLLSILSPGIEPTKEDMDQMMIIQTELDDFLLMVKAGRK